AEAPAERVEVALDVQRLRRADRRDAEQVAERVRVRGQRGAARVDLGDELVRDAAAILASDLVERGAARGERAVDAARVLLQHLGRDAAAAGRDRLLHVLHVLRARRVDRFLAALEARTGA